MKKRVPATCFFGSGKSFWLEHMASVHGFTFNWQSEGVMQEGDVFKAFGAMSRSEVSSTECLSTEIPAQEVGLATRAAWREVHVAQCA